VINEHPRNRAGAGIVRSALAVMRFEARVRRFGQTLRS